MSKKHKKRSMDSLGLEIGRRIWDASLAEPEALGDTLEGAFGTLVTTGQSVLRLSYDSQKKIVISNVNDAIHLAPATSRTTESS